MRGYFGIGIEGISKSMNIGSLFRTANAFNASFVFTVAANYSRSGGNRSDTSDAPGHMPFYSFPNITSMVLPAECTLIGVELTDDAIELPSFRHPLQATYILGPERGSISSEMTEKCEFIVKIPSQFCINVGVAGAIIMYDRIKSLGKFKQRPIRPGGSKEDLPKHVFGDPIIRKKIKKFRDTQPVYDTEIDTA
jgi:tRNA G18 (ribose-2'-O)-methylase SpoU|tara:strand:- start:46 stop:627 length:582 start_codon:yes stop_codon:yes gene_type:complete